MRKKPITGFAAPESVLLNGKEMFVSNIGAKPEPMAKDGDGFISKLSADGKMISQKFQQGILHAPKGLAVIGKIIYVADIDRVVGFAVDKGNQVYERKFNSAILLNDLCTVDDSTMAISDTFKDSVYLLNMHNGEYLAAGYVAGANGVTYNAATKMLYVCSLGEKMNTQGKLFEKNLNDKGAPFQELPNSPTGFFDGIEFMDANRLLVSDWVSADAKQGKLWIYDLKKQTVESLPFTQSPADIYFDKKTGTVVTPQLLLNRISIATMKAGRIKPF